MRDPKEACEICLSRKLSMFANLTEEELKKITAAKNMISHKKGQTLFYEGTKPLGIFCVRSGVVKTVKAASNGKEQLIHLAKEGDFLGYTSLLSDDVYSSTSTIVKDAKVCFIPKEAFLEVLRNDVQFHYRVTENICRDLGNMEERLTDANQKSIRERLAFALLKLVHTFGVEDDRGEKIDIVLSREEIASLVGTATETIIRLLSEFKKDKLIALQGKYIHVLDKKSLSKVADFYQ
ncbi:Crp/Fnr family transcriptional regulator [Litoribacter ruber]|uniref:Crp/Fnr family transcriptional regulator n=1 Tax=Litoribacter ruber TaxID=702568 RepID=UPI001FEA82E2|nr:Crp/Fnr family transcriptional regulator [Litoribacter ruber]